MRTRECDARELTMLSCDRCGQSMTFFSPRESVMTLEHELPSRGSEKVAGDVLEAVASTAGVPT
jgi:hypothetical protein